MAPIQGLWSIPIEWSKRKENQRKSKDSEGPSGGSEFQWRLFKAWVRPPLNGRNTKEIKGKAKLLKGQAAGVKSIDVQSVAVKSVDV